MSAATQLIAEVNRHGAAAWRLGDRVRIVPSGRLPADLRAELVRHRAELLSLLPDAPPDVAALPAMEPEPWIVSSQHSGNMRLVVAAPPPDWPLDVYRAAALVEILDTRHRADRADAQEIGEQLEYLLAALRRQGIAAWLTS